MKNIINGQRREDRAKRTVICGMSAALAPILAPVASVWAGWDTSGVILVTMTTTIGAAAFVGLLLGRVTRRMLRDQRSFDEERRHWRDEAHTDPLCRIPNRRGAFDAASGMRSGAAASSHWTVIAFDIDSFKKVNDTHGHAVGDRVLTAVAEEVAAGIAEGMVAARWGGDEFVVLGVDDMSRGAGEVDAAVVGLAERISAAVRERTVPCREGDLTVEVSYGVARGPVHHELDDVLAVADGALMRAKAALRRPIRLMAEPSIVTVASRTRPAGSMHDDVGADYALTSSAV